MPADGSDDNDFRAPLARFAGARPPAPDWFARALGRAPERSFLDVGGARIELLCWGESGKPGLLLLHGARAHADWWSFIAPFLAGEFRVAAISWSGMGRSDWRAAYSVEGFAAEALAAAEAAGLFEAAEKPVVAAHSFGGWVALHLAATAGERFKAAAILDAGPRPPDEPATSPWPGRENRVYRTMDAALARFRLVPAQPCPNPFILDHVARKSLKPVVADGREGFTWRFDPYLFDRIDPAFRRAVDAALPEARCPLALVWGERSALMTEARVAYARTRAPAGTAFVPIAEAAHHLTLDQPLAVVAALRALVAGWSR